MGSSSKHGASEFTCSSEAVRAMAFCRVVVCDHLHDRIWSLSSLRTSSDKWVAVTNHILHVVSSFFWCEMSVWEISVGLWPTEINQYCTWSNLFTWSLYCPLPELTLDALKDSYEKESEFSSLLQFCEIRTENLKNIDSKAEILNACNWP